MYRLTGFLALLLVSSGCGDETASLGDAYKAAAPPPVTLAIDRSAGTVTIKEKGKPDKAVKMTPRAKDQWPADCAMNFSSHREETVDLAGPLTIGKLTLTKPVLKAECPQGRRAVITQDKKFAMGPDCDPKDCIAFDVP